MSVRTGGNPDCWEKICCAGFDVHQARKVLASAACWVFLLIINGTVEASVTGPPGPTGTWAIPRLIPAFLNPAAAHGPLISMAAF